MKFFDQVETQIHFETVKMKRNSEGHKTAIMEFSIKLTDDNKNHLPNFLKTAYSVIKSPSNELGTITFREDVPTRNIDLQALPTDSGGSAEVRLAGVDLTHVHIDWKDLREQDPEVRLYFVVLYPLDKSIGPWILDNFGNDLWAHFGEGQKEMFEEEGSERGDGEEEAPEGHQGDAEPPESKPRAKKTSKKKVAKKKR